ncbi:MAG: serine protease [Deltaproteobacteria bacterium]|nr:serine protease [Deltaproteobacteria bacterium]
MMIYFSPNDPDTREFLLRIGLNEQELSRGHVTGVGCDLQRIDSFSLKTIASFQPLQRDEDRPEENVFVLNPREAKKGLELISSYGPQKVLGLFREGCSESSDILNNLLGKNKNLRLFGAVFPASCPYNYLFPPVQVLGVHYPDNFVPGEITKAGKAVIRIMIPPEGGGSAVLVSDKGDLLTARHNLYDRKTGQFKNAKIKIGERKIFLREEDITHDELGLDLVQLRVSGLKGFPYLKIADQAVAGEEVWAIGFPDQISYLGTGLERLSTLGTITHFEDGNSLRVNTNARAAPGNSGGALINSNGELIAIVTAVETVGAWNTAIVQPDSTRASIPPKKW